jgi:hypothetical protein
VEHPAGLSDDGTPLTVPRFIVGPFGKVFPESIQNAEAAWDGSSFAVAWTNPVSGNFVSAGVTHIDANGRSVEPEGATPAIGIVRYSPSLAPAPAGVIMVFETIYSDVSRAAWTAIPRVIPFRRRVTS